MVAYKQFISYCERPSTSCTTDHRSSIHSLGCIERSRASFRTRHNIQTSSAALFVCPQSIPCKSYLLDSDLYVVRMYLLDGLFYHRDRILQVSSLEPFLLHNIPASCPSGSHHKGNHQYSILLLVYACDPSPCCKPHSVCVLFCGRSTMINHYKG